jgi:hypothetical protein
MLLSHQVDPHHGNSRKNVSSFLFPANNILYKCSPLQPKLFLALRPCTSKNAHKKAKILPIKYNKEERRV